MSESPLRQLSKKAQAAIERPLTILMFINIKNNILSFPTHFFK